MTTNNMVSVSSMPARLQDRETLKHQIAVLVAYHGLTTATAYDVLKAGNYDATRAAGIVRQAKAAGQSVKDYIAAMVSE